MEFIERQLRTPEERVGGLPKASLPPPDTGSGVSSGDETLLRALNHRDEKAFACVMDLYFPAMLRLALVHVDSRAAAEDVVQETWLAALRGIDRFEGRSSVKTWLFHILRNIARTRGRRDSRMRPLSELQHPDPAESGTDAVEMIVDARTARAGHGHAALWVSAGDPAQQLLSRELADHIDRAIATLPARQREVIVLRDVEGWSAEDVCNVMGISQTNQRVILHRARDRVRNELQEYLDGDGCRDDD